MVIILDLLLACLLLLLLLLLIDGIVVVFHIVRSCCCLNNAEGGVNNGVGEEPVRNAWMTTLSQHDVDAPRKRKMQTAAVDVEVDIFCK